MKKRILLIIITVINAFLMLLLSFWLMTLPFNNGDELLVIEWGSKIKKIFLGLEKKPSKEDFIFINVAYDKQLTDKLDDNGFPIGKQVITDRYKLGHFLEILGKKPQNQKFIIGDVFFGDSVGLDPCRNDSISPDFRLYAAMKKLPNLMLSYHLKENDSIDYPIFRDIPRGLSDYTTTEDIFLKFQFVKYDSIPTLPLEMYKFLHKKEVKKEGLFLLSEMNILLNTHILDIKIRNYDLFVAEEKYKMDNLENILSGVMNEEAVLEYVKDRIIVIGDFEVTDNHKTIYGDTAGSLLLVNAYLNLRDGDNRLTVWLFLYLFSCYALISYLTFQKEKQLVKWVQESKFIQKIKFLRFLRNPNILDFVGNATTLLLTSMGSFLLFDVQLGILYLTLYLFIIRRVAGYLKLYE